MARRLWPPLVLLALLACTGCGEAAVRQVSDRRAAGPDVEHAVGQMLMTHMSGLAASPGCSGASAAARSAALILYGENIDSRPVRLLRLTRSLQRAAAAGGNPPLLIGTDQEGGSGEASEPGAPPTISARQMGASAHRASVARAQGLRDGGASAPSSGSTSISRRSPTSRAAATTSSVTGRSDPPAGCCEGATGFAEGLAKRRRGRERQALPRGWGSRGSRDSDFSIVSIGAPAGRLRDGLRAVHAR